MTVRLNVPALLLSVLLLPLVLSCASRAPSPLSGGEGGVIARYVEAFNAHDEARLRAVVADSALYVSSSGQTRPLIEQNIESWSNPGTAGARLRHGELDGRNVLVVWTKPVLEDGTEGEWTPGAVLDVDVRGERIARAEGTFVLDDPATQERIRGARP